MKKSHFGIFRAAADIMVISSIIAFLVLDLALAADTNIPAPGEEFTIQRVFGVITGIACYLSEISFVVIVIVLAFYGIRFAASRGNVEAYGRAKKGLLWAIVGVIIILGTYTIIATVANAVGAKVSPIPINCSDINL